MKQVRARSRKLLPTQSFYKVSFIVIVRASRGKMSAFGTFANNNFSPIFRMCPRINDQDYGIFIKNNVIYKIPCIDCNSVYISESKRKFQQHVQQHTRAVQNGNVEKNEIAELSRTKDHVVNWEVEEIIGKEQRWIARKIKETINKKSKSMVQTLGYIVAALTQEIKDIFDAKV